jgi:periplasmic divalent cation tolerance protein
MPERVAVVTVTAPVDRAAELAEAIVEARLAACVNIVPEIESVYWWKGAIQRENESLLIIKTRQAAVEELGALLARLHPYENFELIAVDVAAGSKPYLDWIVSETAR